MPSEADIKRRMVNEVKEAGGYARRIEDQYGVGIPDLIVAMPGIGLLAVEVKLISGLQFKPSPRQLIEMRRIDNGGGIALLVGWTVNGYHLHSTTPTARITDCVIGVNFPETLHRWYNTRRSLNG